jgi:hypothetical protein
VYLGGFVFMVVARCLQLNDSRWHAAAKAGFLAKRGTFSWKETSIPMNDVLMLVGLGLMVEIVLALMVAVRPMHP